MLLIVKEIMDYSGHDVIFAIDSNLLKPKKTEPNLNNNISYVIAF